MKDVGNVDCRFGCHASQTDIVLVCSHADASYLGSAVCVTLALIFFKPISVHAQSISDEVCKIEALEIAKPLSTT
jgi:hypothetical protein